MKTKKVLISTLSTLLALGMSVGCGVQKTESSSVDSSENSSVIDSSSSTGPSEEEYEPVKLKDNGESLSDYKIVLSATAGKSYYYAAEVLQKYLAKSTGITVPVITDAEGEGTHEILIGETNRTEDDDVDFAALGDESFVVKSVDNDLVIAGNKRGCIYGVYQYLEALGYRFYAVDAEYVPKSRNVFIAEDADFEWTPVFTHRDPFYESMNDLYEDSTKATEFALSQRVNSSFIRSLLRTEEKYGGGSGWIGGDGMMVHTVGKLVPYSSYKDQHPEWFTANGENPCFTNQEFLDELYTKMLFQIDRDNTGNTIDVSMNDSGVYCQCDSCQAQYAIYGVSETYYRAINSLAVRLKTDRPGVRINTLSYAFALEPPETLVFEDNVDITVCLTMCRFHTDPEECHEMGMLYADSTSDIRSLKTEQERLLGWDGHASSIRVWYYAINWGMLYAADPSYEAMYNNFQFFADNNVTGIYAEAYSRKNPEFGELKAYLTAKLMANPYMSKAEYYYHMDDFLQGYYGEGGEYIRKYIDRAYELILDNMKEIGHLKHWYDLSDNFNFNYDPQTKKFAPFVDEFNELWDSAEESATPEQLLRIEKSRIHWDYIELYNTWDRRYENATLEEKEEMEARSEDLYKRIRDFGVVQRYDNDGTIKTVTDFSLSPTMWWG